MCKLKKSKEKGGSQFQASEECCGELADQRYITYGELEWKEKDQSLNTGVIWLQTQPLGSMQDLQQKFPVPQSQCKEQQLVKTQIRLVPDCREGTLEFIAGNTSAQQLVMEIYVC